MPRIHSRRLMGGAGPCGGGNLFLECPNKCKESRPVTRLRHTFVVGQRIYPDALRRITQRHKFKGTLRAASGSRVAGGAGAFPALLPPTLPDQSGWVGPKSACPGPTLGSHSGVDACMGWVGESQTLP